MIVEMTDFKPITIPKTVELDCGLTLRIDSYTLLDKNGIEMVPQAIEYEAISDSNIDE